MFGYFLKVVSLICGRLLRLPLPAPLAGLSIRIFCRLYKIELNEVEGSVESFRSIGDFFVRDLKPAARPIGENLVAPVDGMLRACGKIEAGRLEQIKGKDYALEDFLGSPEIKSYFWDGTFYNFYLSPKDCHHIFAPVEFEVEQVVHIPGKLWPVNDWAINNVERLFCVNERVVVLGKSAIGRVCLVMVGATNVGRIEVRGVDLLTNTTSNILQRKPQRFEVCDLRIGKGEKIGTFHMGSSVVMLLEPGRGVPHQSFLEKSCPVKYGLDVGSCE